MDALIVSDPHCDFLGYLTETGILGAGAFIFFIATFLRRALTHLKKKVKDNEYFKIRLFCFFASFIGMLLDSIDVDVFKIRHLWFLMALTLAFIMMHKNKIDNADSRF
ncbi:MAG: hypothetical protein AMJ78_03095 [Omnitrophica WOR_2 bacterium SM23_29]|nr:MAG: hypothetical protein AMJ78_03095 [Omnitrophica WOR_2 bacterium SM23_29]